MALDPRDAPEQVRMRTLRDVAMVALGAASLAIIVYDFLQRPRLSAGEVQLLELVDLLIVLVFVAEFVVRWRAHQWAARFVLRNWFDVLGMVPLMATNFPLFRALRLVRVVTIASRLLRAWSFVTGEKSGQLVLNRYRERLVEEVTDAVMLRMLAMAEGWVASGAYAKVVGDSLEQRRADIAAMAVDASKANDLGPYLRMVPGFEAVVRKAAETAVDTAIAALRSEEMQRTLETTLKGLLDQVQAEVAEKEWKQRRAARQAGSG